MQTSVVWEHLGSLSQLSKVQTPCQTATAKNAGPLLPQTKCTAPRQHLVRGALFPGQAGLRSSSPCSPLPAAEAKWQVSMVRRKDSSSAQAPTHGIEVFTLVHGEHGVPSCASQLCAVVPYQETQAKETPSCRLPPPPQVLTSQTGVSLREKPATVPSPALEPGSEILQGLGEWGSILEGRELLCLPRGTNFIHTKPAEV